LAGWCWDRKKPTASKPDEANGPAHRIEIEAYFIEIERRSIFYRDRKSIFYRDRRSIFYRDRRSNDFIEIEDAHCIEIEQAMIL